MHIEPDFTDTDLPVQAPVKYETVIRNRTNVWDYAGVNTMRAGRLEELAMHPTVKPVALVADAIKDCSDGSACANGCARSAR